jgi:Protein of unknown function (DUF2752)
VSIHGPEHLLGLMDPQCGMTRAVQALARGQLGTAWAYNPASFPLAFAGVGILIGSVVGRVNGRWPTITFTRPEVVRVAAALLVALLWANQQLHASRLG